MLMAKRKRRARARKKGVSKRGTRRTLKKRASKRAKRRTRAKPVHQRTIEFHEPASAHIVRDQHEAVRYVLHTDKPVWLKAANAFAAAQSYLRAHGERLGLRPKELESLHLRPQTEATNVG